MEGQYLSYITPNSHRPLVDSHTLLECPADSSFEPVWCYLLTRMIGSQSTDITVILELNYIYEMSDCCLTPSEQFSVISLREQVTFRWHDDMSVLY